MHLWQAVLDMRRTEPGTSLKLKRGYILVWPKQLCSALLVPPAELSVTAQEVLGRAGGLLSKDSPFLDIILEGVKLRLPSADVAYPRVEPALGAALLVHDALQSNSASVEEAAGSPFASTPPRLGRHQTVPHSQGEAACTACCLCYSTQSTETAEEHKQPVPSTLPNFVFTHTAVPVVQCGTSKP